MARVRHRAEVYVRSAVVVVEGLLPACQPGEAEGVTGYEGIPLPRADSIEDVNWGVIQVQLPKEMKDLGLDYNARLHSACSCIM